ncbi:hypothetical protein CXF68_20400 [Tenacibaculum sp. Bg11-29]|uniref:hypothetical protein n=1 Tax=Tenacibaculum sp. Bg11-29 TaxID=2058306 RepID=UPI000C31FDF4|nr:hypothetical protein [Tenacibaculum sp. Bg11-29]PKH52916.1 hypothetical protein CXF68_20400 [Tenacibaculum sp. Bg11-29]
MKKIKKMEFKKIIIFTFFNIIILNTFCQEIDNKQEQGFVKNYNLLKSIQGNWKLVHLFVDGIEIDCEHFEKYLSKNLSSNKNNQEEITEKFNNFCKINDDKIMEVSHNSIFDKNLNKMTFFKLDNNLKENIIVINKKQNKVEFKIIRINDNYFKLLHTDKMWLKFKKISD